MPVIACPDCGRDVSTLAPVCPHCGRPSPAGTTPIAPSAAPKLLPEQTLWTGTPSWATLGGKLGFMLLVLLVVPLVGHFFAQRTPDLDAQSRITRIAWLITLVVLIYEAVTFLVALFRIRSTVYTITNQRVMIEAGLLSKSVSEIDLRYIDDSNFYQSVMARLLGLGDVTIISSDKSTPMYVLRNIKDPRGVREIIRANAYQVSQRQIFTRAT
jgi:membrane protein YdbS with pleckstrin-like domain